MAVIELFIWLQDPFHCQKYAYISVIILFNSWPVYVVPKSVLIYTVMNSNFFEWTGSTLVL